MAKKIEITSHEVVDTPVGKKHIVHDDRLKYEFFENKKDGGKTKAFEQWETFGLGVGDSVSAEVREEPQSFTNSQGKEINFTRRTILWFEGDEHGTPYVQEAKGGLEKRVENLENRMFELEAMLESKANPSDLPF